MISKNFVSLRFLLPISGSRLLLRGGSVQIETEQGWNFPSWRDWLIIPKCKFEFFVHNKICFIIPENIRPVFFTESGVCAREKQPPPQNMVKFRSEPFLHFPDLETLAGSSKKLRYMTYDFSGCKIQKKSVTMLRKCLLGPTNIVNSSSEPKHLYYGLCKINTLIEP